MLPKFPLPAPPLRLSLGVPLNLPTCPPLASFPLSPTLLSPPSAVLHWQVIRKEDDCHVVREEFNVLVVTKFRAEDYAAFLGDELPLALHQSIRVVC